MPRKAQPVLRHHSTFHILTNGSRPYQRKRYTPHHSGESHGANRRSHGRREHHVILPFSLAYPIHFGGASITQQWGSTWKASIPERPAGPAFTSNRRDHLPVEATKVKVERLEGWEIRVAAILDERLSVAIENGAVPGPCTDRPVQCCTSTPPSPPIAEHSPEF